MARYPPMGVSAVVDGYQDYVRNVGKMASATERSHSRIGALGAVGFKGLVTGAKFAAGAIVGIGVAAGTALTAVGGLAAKLAIDAAPIVDLELGFNAIAENAGQVGSEVLAAMKDVTAGTIRAADLMQLYNKGTTLLGDNFQTIIPFMDQIIAQGAAIGLKPLQAVEDFTTGVARESKMILDNLGIIVRIDEATETYATTLGKTASELTAVERQSAILSSAMTSLKKTSTALPSLNEFATTSLEKLKVTFQETKDEIGKALVPALLELVNSFQDALGPGALDIVDIFKRDFVPVLTRIAQVVGANLPKAIDFAKRAFIFFGRVIRGLWNFVEKWVIPGFNFLYRIFVDKIAPIVKKVGRFFGDLWDLFFFGEGVVGNLRQKLLDMIPDAVKDAWETLKTKAGEWYDIAQEWIDTHGPEMLQAFTDVKDYIVETFIPEALEFLTESFEPVIEAAGRLFDSLMDDVPDVVAAWESIKSKAIEVFEKRSPAILENFKEAWTGLMELIAGDIEKTNLLWGEHGDTVIETVGKIIEFGIDVLGMAIETLARTVNLAVTAMLGDWERFREIFGEGAGASADFLGEIFGGTALGDLLDIQEPGAEPTTELSDLGNSFADFVENLSAASELTGMNMFDPALIGGVLGAQVLAPATVQAPGGGRISTDTQTDNFNLTINTSAPVESTIQDFHMMSALARH